MKKIIDLIYKILIFLFFPLIFLLLFWYLSIPFIKEKYIFLFLIFGFCIGLIINSIYYKRIIKNLYKLNLKFLLIIYFFYNFCIYIFFMGVPIFNLIMSFISGLYIGRRCKFQNLNEQESYKFIRKVSLFTTLFIFIIFSLSGYIAIKDPFTGLNIQGLLNLKNPLTKNQVYYLVIIGGIAFLFLNYYLTKTISTLEYKKKN